MAATNTMPVADLGKVLVEGSALSKYRPETVSSGTFTDIPPEKLPIVVDTLTEDFIREHNPTDLHDLLRYVPGIETGGKSLLVRNPGQFSLRGMGGTEPTFDGILPIGRGPGLFMDTFLMDRIEIAKGPIASLGGGAGASQNASGAGGSVSMFLKSAHPNSDETAIQENSSFGKDTQRHRAMADSNQTFGEGAGAVRVVGTADYYEPAYIRNGSQKGADARESYTLAPSFIYALAEDVVFGVKSLFSTPSSLATSASPSGAASRERATAGTSRHAARMTARTTGPSWSAHGWTGRSTRTGYSNSASPQWPRNGRRRPASPTRPCRERQSSPITAARAYGRRAKST